MNQILSTYDLLGDVALMRGPPSNANDATTTADTATAAIDARGPVGSGRALPSYYVKRNGRQMGKNSPPGFQGGWNVPAGWFGRYPNKTAQLMHGGDIWIVDGVLVPEDVDLTEQLIGVTADGAYNLNTGDSTVAAPTQLSVFPAGHVAFFHAGPGRAQFFRIIGGASGGTITYRWWAAGR